jgi:predicted flap endonuclease-1-like 5' DNA nuclease
VIAAFAAPAVVEEPAPQPAAPAPAAEAEAEPKPERARKPKVDDADKPSRKSAGKAERDDLKRIEGIGPKMEKALNTAGIETFARLAEASEDELRAAITAQGLRFAPSLPTWARQARFLADGDIAGFEAFKARLIAGRDPG